MLVAAIAWPRAGPDPSGRRSRSDARRARRGARSSAPAKQGIVPTARRARRASTAAGNGRVPSDQSRVRAAVDLQVLTRDDGSGAEELGFETAPVACVS